MRRVNAEAVGQPCSLLLFRLGNGCWLDWDRLGRHFIPSLSRTIGTFLGVHPCGLRCGASAKAQFFYRIGGFADDLLWCEEERCSFFVSLTIVDAWWSTNIDHHP